MKPLTPQQMDVAIEKLKGVASEDILKRINQLDQNLATLTSSRITIVCLPEYRKIQATRDLLVVIMRRRDGRALPPKITPVPKRPVPRGPQGNRPGA